MRALSREYRWTVEWSEIRKRHPAPTLVVDVLVAGTLEEGRRGHDASLRGGWVRPHHGSPYVGPLVEWVWGVDVGGRRIGHPETRVVRDGLGLGELEAA